jgi:hypothetical protein
MATSLSLENDPSLAQGYIKVNGTTAATITTSGITGNLTGNADTATKFSTTTGSAPAYACRAWVNFDGTRDSSGATSTANTNRFIRASGNVTSVLRNGTGDYTITFTTPMTDADYCASGICCSGSNITYSSGAVPYVCGPQATPTTSQFRFGTGTGTVGGGSGVRSDQSFTYIQVFGN